MNLNIAIPLQKLLLQLLYVDWGRIGAKHRSQLSDLLQCVTFTTGLQLDACL